MLQVFSKMMGSDGLVRRVVLARSFGGGWRFCSFALVVSPLKFKVRHLKVRLVAVRGKRTNYKVVTPMH